MKNEVDEKNGRYKRKRYVIALLCCIALLILALAGCGEQGVVAQEVEPEIESVLETVRFEDALFSYDGLPHLPVLSGAPEGASIRYTDDNGLDTYGKVFVGEYRITASVRYGNEGRELYATVTIVKAKAAIRFEDKTFTYDGEEHSLEAVGVPSDIVVRYENNGQSEEGEYKVKASFDVGPNYEEVEDMYATLRIVRPRHTVTFKFEEDGEAKEIKIEVPHGLGVEEKDVPSVPYRRGYIGRWEGNYVEIYEDEVVEAKYEIITYTLTLKYADGSVEEREFTVEDEIILPDEKAARWQIALGWYDRSGQKYEKIEKGTAWNVTLTAETQDIEYIIRYDLDGNGMNDFNNVNNKALGIYVYTHDDEKVLTLNDPEWAGHIFKGWIDEDTGEYIEEIPFTACRDFYLRADWELEVYTIIYYDGEREMYRQEFTVEDEPVELYAPTKIGYRFMFWQDEEGEKVEYVGLHTEIKLYAVWEMETYEVKYYFEGAEVHKDSYNVESGIEELYKHEGPKGYEVDWYADGEKVDSIEKGRTGNLELEGRKRALIYRITYIYDGDNGGNPEEYTIEDLPLVLKAGVAATEEREFECWTLKDGGAVVEIITEEMLGDIELEGKDMEKSGVTVENGIVIAYKTTAGGELIIPKEVKGQAVTGIGFEVLKDDITDLRIEAEIKAIGDALSGCTGLKRLSLSNIVLTDGLLRNCAKLEELELENGGYGKRGVDYDLYGVSYLFGDAAKEGHYSVPCNEMQRYDIASDSYTRVDTGKIRYIPESLKIVRVRGDAEEVAFTGMKSLEEVYISGELKEYALSGVEGLRILDIRGGSIVRNSLREAGEIAEIRADIGMKDILLTALKNNGMAEATVYLYDGDTVEAYTYRDGAFEAAALMSAANTNIAYIPKRSFIYAK